MRNVKPCALVATALLAGLWLTSAAAGSPDHIFADGFDPCCQIGGTVSGLSSSGLVLHLSATAISEDHAISGNGSLRLCRQRVHWHFLDRQRAGPAQRPDVPSDQRQWHHGQQHR